jgi:broad specificity polyphosphatase/5'/3'-nucleotidase SurE
MKSKASRDPLRQSTSGRSGDPAAGSARQHALLDWPAGDKCDAGPDTDFAAVDEGYVSVTPLHVDLTAYSAHDVVSGWLDRAGVNAQW